MPRYDPHVIEPKWQRAWEAQKTFRAVERPGAPKLYVLDMFPYPSGEGLHVGHPEGYTATDMWCRYQRMRGFNVLHPMGYDAFGLPAEQYAIQTGTHPRVSTERNVANIRRQIKRLGFSYDWDREIATTDPAYVKWTQWIFPGAARHVVRCRSRMDRPAWSATRLVIVEMNEQRERAKRYNDAICPILLRDWDPIRVVDIPEAHDEYNMYADGVAGILMRGEPKQKLVESLWTIETENMGLDGNRTRVESAAIRLLQVRREIDGDA